MDNLQAEMERRISERLSYRGYCTLFSATEEWDASILNMSKTGLLIAILDDFNLETDEQLNIQIELDPQGSVSLEGHVAHQKEHLVGIAFAPSTSDDQKKLEAFLTDSGLPLCD